ncbi:MAG TPA: peptide chain release factor N(5)-glutamine methyltransferase, partial [Burkholderiales bacterium]|nr:peptide chain release factor N(5)-glutamine methyltransferase [Burkholderiales bacterium]
GRPAGGTRGSERRRLSAVHEVLAAAAARLAPALGLEAESARIEARSLLSYLLGRDRSWLAAHGRDPLPPADEAAFEALLARRRAGEPVAYITGWREFYGLDFQVTPAVLIPRPETELLVDLALERLPAHELRRVLDLGTGSGCVAIAIAAHRPLAEVTAVDASEAALAVARENASRLLPQSRRDAAISFQRSDWFSALKHERFDLIVSNPPYVAEGDPHLEQGDLPFEPRSALAAGADGLDGIRHIVSEAPAHLDAGGWLLFEHGYDQAAACRNLLRVAGLQETGSFRDLAGIERVSGARRLTP